MVFLAIAADWIQKRAIGLFSKLLLLILFNVYIKAFQL